MNIKQMKQELNNIAHTRWGTFVLYHGWWFLVAICHYPVSVIFLAISGALHALALLLGSNPRVPIGNRRRLVVAVSGCDSGFGRDLALALADGGFLVLAGCLGGEAVDNLTALGTPGLVATLLDVTSEASVADFVARLGWLVTEDPKQHRRLYALVNNAGVGTGGAVDWLKMSDYEFNMNVNFYGMVRLTKACLPLLKAAAAMEESVGPAAGPSLLKARARFARFTPRIVNVTSCAGLVTTGFMSA
mmetsp:Transcript_41843/g.94519  ORF Transcript_41843/g.94519 Transcript_41843/m.94519 type:complete len:246 (-) Transcript_41843:939-1676(-)